MTTAVATGAKISSGSLAALLVAGAMGTSSIVFSEPAIADVLMAGVIVGVPVLGAGVLGRVTTANLALWLIIVAFGVFGTTFSVSTANPLVHQLVTLYLALGAATLAAYVAQDPLPRFHLIMTFYTVGALIAAGAGILGYFTQSELLTNFGRARGTFKDPNVLGAAMVPAMVYCLWAIFRQPPFRAIIAAGAAGVLAIALLLSFSRGAWAAAVVSLMIAAWLILVTSTKTKEIVRFAVLSGLGLLCLILALGALLRMDAVKSLFEQRASLNQSYDLGPEGRFGGQRKAIRLILDNPLGIGTHTFRTIKHPEEAHNVYLTTFMNAGWIGGLLYVISIIVTAIVGFRGVLSRGPLQGPFVIAAASFGGLAAEGLIIDSDHWRHFFILMGLVWGLSDALSRQTYYWHGRSS